MPVINRIELTIIKQLVIQIGSSSRSDVNRSKLLHIAPDVVFNS